MAGPKVGGSALDFQSLGGRGCVSGVGLVVLARVKAGDVVPQAEHGEGYGVGHRVVVELDVEFGQCDAAGRVVEGRQAELLELAADPGADLVAEPLCRRAARADVGAEGAVDRALPASDAAPAEDAAVLGLACRQSHVCR